MESVVKALVEGTTEKPTKADPKSLVFLLHVTESPGPAYLPDCLGVSFDESSSGPLPSLATCTLLSGPAPSIDALGYCGCLVPDSGV